MKNAQKSGHINPPTPKSGLPAKTLGPVAKQLLVELQATNDYIARTPYIDDIVCDEPKRMRKRL